VYLWSKLRPPSLCAQYTLVGVSKDQKHFFVRRNWFKDPLDVIWIYKQDDSVESVKRDEEIVRSHARDSLTVIG
jgi:hypothetical protein